MRLQHLLLAFILGGILLNQSLPSAAITLPDIQNGVAQVKIVTPDAPSPTETFAAQEMQKHLCAIFSLKNDSQNFQIIPENQSTAAQSKIFLGQCRHLSDNSDFNENLDRLYFEGFRIKALGDNLYICGGRAMAAQNPPYAAHRGTLYGVYTFLEETLGCRWYTSEVDKNNNATGVYIPKMKSIRLDSLDITQSPAFKERMPVFVSYNGAIDANQNFTALPSALLSARHKVNSSWGLINVLYKTRDANRPFKDPTGETLKYGGTVLYRATGALGPQNFYTLLPPSEYFKSHPEYYSLVRGKRIGANGQICLTNNDVYKIVVKKLEASINRYNNDYTALKHKFNTGTTCYNYFKNGPSDLVVGLGANDIGGYACECDRCQAIVKQESSEMGPMLRFVNRVAKQLKKDYPHINLKVLTLAYMFTEKPPQHILPADNVIIQYCPIYNCQIHPHEQCKYNIPYMQNLEKWREITRKSNTELQIWSYNQKVESPDCLPFPNWDEMTSDFKYYQQLGVTGIKAQGTRGGDYLRDLDELHAYVVAKLMWNPSVDVSAVIDDFVKGYYGAAGGWIRKYIDLLQTTARNTPDEHFTITSRATLPNSNKRYAFLSAEVLNQATIYFDEAEKAVASDKMLLDRVKRARLSLRYARKDLPDVIDTTYSSDYNELKTSYYNSLRENF